MSPRRPTNVRDADELSSRELQALDPDRTLCVCAVSALEVHGPHLPVGSDLHQAAWMADETGARFVEQHPDWTVLRFPALPIGTDELPLPGSINSPPRVVYRIIRAFGDQLAAAGFRYVMLTNGHGGPRHAAALEAACRRVSRRHGVSMFTPSIRALHQLVSGAAFDRVEKRLGRPLTEEERQSLVSDSHAGAWETSWYLARRPELVGPEYASLPEVHPPKLEAVARFGSVVAAVADRLGRKTAADGIRQISAALAESLGWLLNARFGYGGPERVSYSGAPALASKELGEAYAEISVELCLEDVEAVVSGRVDALDIRSIASDPFLIQPYFPRVAGATLVAAGLGLLWLIL